MLTLLRINCFPRLLRTFRLGIDINVRRIAHRGELKALSVMKSFTVIDHGGHVHPVAAIIELGLASGMILMERDIKITHPGIRGPHAPYPVVGNGGVVLHIDGIRLQLVRQGQDLIGVIGRIRWSIRTGR